MGDFVPFALSFSEKEQVNKRFLSVEHHNETINLIHTARFNRIQDSSKIQSRFNCRKHSESTARQTSRSIHASGTSN